MFSIWFVGGLTLLSTTILVLLVLTSKKLDCDVFLAMLLNSVKGSG